MTRRLRLLAAVTASFILSACGSSGSAPQNPGSGTGGGGGGGGGGSVPGLATASQVAQALGRTPHFLIGFG
ncbi:MAG TPA: hypothetical protein VE964_15745, partial [Myxococcales bacterium]|nr:hypothetical protein [Myxococcales bacterium]